MKICNHIDCVPRNLFYIYRCTYNTLLTLLYRKYYPNIQKIDEEKFLQKNCYLNNKIKCLFKMYFSLTSDSLLKALVIVVAICAISNDAFIGIVFTTEYI